MRARWVVELADEFEPEFDALHEDVREGVYALWLVLEAFGPQLGRPRADTLKGSTYSNMKELRFSAADGEWRGGVCFCSRGRGVLVGGGGKTGGGGRGGFCEVVWEGEGG